MTTSGEVPFVTFDLFSALLDSRLGASKMFDTLAVGRNWSSSGQQIYDDWDRRNKTAQADTRSWVPFRRLAEDALRATYVHLALDGEVHQDCAELLASVTDWPLWSDVELALKGIGRKYRIGILSNVDDDIFAISKVAPLVNAANALTSQRLRAYKPNAQIYRLARHNYDVKLHIAASARDVRGASEAGLPIVRVARPGHHLDPRGPAPTRTVESLDVIAAWPSIDGPSQR